MIERNIPSGSLLVIFSPCFFLFFGQVAKQSSKPKWLYQTVMGRPRKWVPRRVTAADRVAGHAVVVKYGPDLRLEKRLSDDFRSFCILNRLTREEAYVPFIGQLRNSKVAAGTVKNYVEIVSRGDRSTEAYLARRSTECMQTNTPTGHAADIDLKTANSIIVAAKKRYPQHAPSIWMMLATGCRRIDVHRLRPESVKLTKANIVVKFLWTKGIRKIRHRRTVTLPLRGIASPPTNMQTLLSGKRAPFECSVNTLNKVLKELVSKDPGVRCTTGSFRRLFSRRIEEYCKKKGLKKKDLLLHRSEDMDEAFYSFA